MRSIYNFKSMTNNLDLFQKDNPIHQNFVSGFAFYTTATSLVASFAGLFGLTLPFGFYTGLTSTIAILASPLFLLPFLLGGGIWLTQHQNKSLKKKLLPIVLMQITLPYMSKGSGSIQFDSFNGKNDITIIYILLHT